MKKVFISVVGLFLSFSASAECPQLLNADKMVECIMIEGSGANYQDWKKDMDKTDAQLATTISPVTGVDVTKLKPAAGKAK